MKGWKITWGTQKLIAGSLKTYSSDYKRLNHEMNKIMKPRYSGAGSNDLYKPKFLWFENSWQLLTQHNCCEAKEG